MATLDEQVETAHAVRPLFLFFLGALADLAWTPLPR
jgi:hypothetical protein